mmetsp:Transcript_3286/g.12301  ORF Transcript_3286/g.12301 Transcript_3286/m.12301 type:complete len:231 (+) Transcript_3286:370-1062(+)
MARGAGNRRTPAPAPAPTRPCRRTAGTTPPRRRTAPSARVRSRSGSAEGARGTAAPATQRVATRLAATQLAEGSRGGSASIRSPRRSPRKPTASTRDRTKPPAAGAQVPAGVPARARRRGGVPRSTGLSLRRIAKTAQTRRRGQTPIRAPIRVTPASRREFTRPTDAGDALVVECAATVSFFQIFYPAVTISRRRRLFVASPVVPSGVAPPSRSELSLAARNHRRIYHIG